MKTMALLTMALPTMHGYILTMALHVYTKVLYYCFLLKTMALLTMALLTTHGYLLTMALHVHTKAAPVQRGLSIGPERSGANFVIKVYGYPHPYPYPYHLSSP